MSESCEIKYFIFINIDSLILLVYDTYQYYVKVVSTEVTYMNGSTVLTNQFASTEHQRDVTPVFGNLPTAMPGIF